MLIVVFVSVLVEGAGDSFIIVVFVSFFSAGGFVTVVSFCSQAANKAAPASRQIYFFINRSLAVKSLLVGYGDGDGVVADSGLAAVVASGEAAGLAAGAAVSVFCSHAASNAALARMQMYFFIIMCGAPLWVTS